MATKGQFYIPSFQQGWSGSFYQTKYLAGFVFNLSDQILYAIYPQQQFDVYLKANITLAQALSVANKQLPGSYINPNIPLPDIIYKNQIEGQLPQCILCENGSPLLTESGDYMVIT
jgi:hypothetical protein